MVSKGSIPLYPRYQESTTEFSSVQQIQKYSPHLLSDPSPHRQSSTRKLSAPSLQLTGHGAEVYSCKFSPNGSILATAGFDKSILLWSVYPSCTNYALLKGHTNAILDLSFSSDGSKLYSCSADKSLCIWDLESGKRLKKYKGHTSVINSLDSSRRGTDLIVTSSDDGCLKLWDLRHKSSVSTLDLVHPLPSVSFNETSDKCYVGSLSNSILTIDLRTNQPDSNQQLEGHTDTVTGLSLSHDGSYLLSTSLDSSLRIWDTRPFVLANGNSNGRCLKVFQGFLVGNSGANSGGNLIRGAWSSDGSKVGCGSSDGFVCVWETGTRRMVQRLGGHCGGVNEVAFEGKGEVELIGSASEDKSVIVGEMPKVGL